MAVWFCADRANRVSLSWSKLGDPTGVLDPLGP